MEHGFDVVNCLDRSNDVTAAIPPVGNGAKPVDPIGFAAQASRTIHLQYLRNMSVAPFATCSRPSAFNVQEDSVLPATTVIRRIRNFQTLPTFNRSSSYSPIT